MTNFPRKTQPRSGWPQLSEIVKLSEVKFIGEQKSSDDDKAKELMRRIALLCVRYVNSVEETLQKGFKHMFEEIKRRGDSYDRLILDESREQELRKVCKPFYEAV
jgi:hypothetical protein